MTRHIINCICHIFLRGRVQCPVSRHGEGDLMQLSGEAGLSPPADRLGGARKSVDLDLLFLWCLYQISLIFYHLWTECMLGNLWRVCNVIQNFNYFYQSNYFKDIYINGRKYNEMQAWIVEVGGYFIFNLLPILCIF